MSINKASASDIKGKRKPPKRITPDYLHNSGLYYLQRFAAAEGQFRAVMLRKVRRSCLFHKEQSFDACAAMVEDLILKFRRAGLLDDAAFTGGAVASYRRRGLSRQAILAKLKTRGIDSAQAAAALAAHDEDNNDAEKIAALTYARKRRLGPFSEKEFDAEKQLATLARQGFSYDTAQSALKITRADAEELLRQSRI